MAKKTDNITLELIKQVNAKKAAISKAEKPQWRTHCTFSYIENASSTINLHVEMDLKKLVKIAAFLMQQEQGYKEAAIKLDVDIPPFTWCGYSAEDWLEDIKARITKLQIGSEKKKLEALETRLNAVMSPELRAELELQAIAEELKCS